VSNAAFTGLDAGLSDSSRPAARGEWKNALYILPFLLVYACLTLYPLSMSFWLSFNRADFFGGHDFAGLQNYLRLANDDIFLGTVRNTLYFVVLTVPVLTVTGLLLALMLNRRSRTATILRMVFFLPCVLSVTIVTLLWRVIFMSDGGLLANVLAQFGIPAVNFLNSVNLALPAIAVVTVWWCLGLPLLLFLAALQQVPAELYEAAALDNAGRWKKFFHVTLPSIRRTLAVVVLVEIAAQLQLFGQAQLMTQGGPNNTSRPVVLFIYEVGFNRWDVGYAAAASQILFLLILAAAMAHYLALRRREPR
jgi:multiple sugar transport system permease protein